MQAIITHHLPATDKPCDNMKNSPCIQPLYNLESKACGRIVALGGGSQTRSLVAQVLRGWRACGEFERARWFRRHAFYISGNLYKDSRGTLRTDCPALICKS